jgi:hypothetical protein
LVIHIYREGDKLEIMKLILPKAVLPNTARIIGHTENNICMEYCVPIRRLLMAEITGLRVPATTSPMWQPQRLKVFLSLPVSHSRGSSKAQEKNALSFTRHSVQTSIAHPFPILPEFPYSGFTTLIHTCSTTVEYFSCQYVISPTTLSFLKELFQLF